MRALLGMRPLPPFASGGARRQMRQTHMRPVFAPQNAKKCNPKIIMLLKITPTMQTREIMHYLQGISNTSSEGMGARAFRHRLRSVLLASRSSSVVGVGASSWCWASRGSSSGLVMPPSAAGRAPWGSARVSGQLACPPRPAPGPHRTDSGIAGLASLRPSLWFLSPVSLRGVSCWRPDPHGTCKGGCPTQVGGLSGPCGRADAASLSATAVHE